MEFFRSSPKFPNEVAGIADVVRTRPIHTLEVASPSTKLAENWLPRQRHCRDGKKRASDRSSSHSLRCLVLYQILSTSLQLQTTLDY